MLWFSNGNHRASLKHNTELATEKNWFSFDKLSISSMKIKPRVYTDSLKCLWRRRCWFCKYFCCWLGRCCCFNPHLHGGEHTFALIQQPASFCSAVWHWRLLAHPSLPLSFESLLCFLVCFSSPRRLCSRRYRASATAELKPSFLQPSCVCCSFSHRQGLFVFVHAASEDGVIACTREISRSFHS